LSDDKDPASPATTSNAYDAMIPTWAMISTLLGGTESMRLAGEVYLPRHEEESTKNYDRRIQQATLFNMLELTLDALVGKPFSDLIKFKEGSPEEIVDLAEDIDLQSNNLTTFGRQWFREGLAKGFAHVFIDMPTMTEEESENRTRADDNKENRRPFWQLVTPENLIFASSEVIEGVEVLTHIRIQEFETIRVGFAEIVKERIRVVERVEDGQIVWALWEKQEKKNPNDKDDWRVIDSGNMDIDVIPLVTFYANRKGLMISKPPLEDLAHLNIRYWQSNSDQINVLTVARFPMLAVSGATDATGDSMAIGPKQLMGTKDPNGKFYYVEHTGKAISSGRDDLTDLEDRMSSYGAEFLRRRPGNQTATARALDSAESTSPLQDHTIRFTDSVNTALNITAKWMDLESGGEVEIALDFGPEEVADIDLRTLNEARRNRDLSRDAYLKELQRRGVLPDDFNFEADIKILIDETVVISPFATGQNVMLGDENSLANKGKSEEDS